MEINNVPFSHLIRLCRNRIASRTGIFEIIILLERSSILLPKASSEALFNFKSVLIREILGLVDISPLGIFPLFNL